MSQRTFLIASAVLATVSKAAADILSCADVACPITAGTAATCTVADKKFDAVGIVSLNSSVDGLKGLSWVKGVGVENLSSNESRFDQSFYLGTPDGFNFDGTGACAVFFTQVSNKVRFGDEDPRRSEGTCSDAMTDACVSALVDRAKGVDLSGLSVSEACEKIRQDFADNLDSACTNFAPASSWSGITAKALSGEGSSQPISEQQNSTSDCWPVLPKSDDLTFVESTNTTGDVYASTLVKNFYSITPILTVFFPGNGSDGLVLQTEAQLTCVKAIDLTTASNSTQNQDGKGNAAGQLLGRGAAVWVGVVSVVFALLMA